MTIPGAPSFFFSSASESQALAIDYSCRIDRESGGYFSRTPSSAGNRTVWTLSLWVKRSGLGAEQRLFSAGSSTTNLSLIEFTSDDNMRILNQPGGSTVHEYKTTRVFRDVSAWYHIVVASNSNSAFKLYINGIEESSFTSSTGPSSSDWLFNSTVLHAIGKDATSLSSSGFSGYLANVEWVDGSFKEASDFGQLNSDNLWEPLEYNGSFGTNGFKLNFSTTTLGADSSGQSNNYTANNKSQVW